MAEPVSTNWRGEQGNALSLRRDFPSPKDARHLVFKNFELAGIRVTERRFAAKDMIFSPVGPDEMIGTKAQQPHAAV